MVVTYGNVLADSKEGGTLLLVSQCVHTPAAGRGEHGMVGMMR